MAISERDDLVGSLTVDPGDRVDEVAHFAQETTTLAPIFVPVGVGQGASVDSIRRHKATG